MKNRFTVGSFGERMYGSKIYAGNGKFESITRLYYYYRKNDFPFLNTVAYDFENKSYKKDKQQGAAIENMGTSSGIQLPI